MLGTRIMRKTGNACLLRFVRPMNYIFRIVAAAGVAIILLLPVVAQAGRHSHRLDEDAALALLDRTLNATAFIRTESLWTALATAPRRQRTLIFSLFSAKSTTPNAAGPPR